MIRSRCRRLVGLALLAGCCVAFHEAATLSQSSQRRGAVREREQGDERRGRGDGTGGGKVSEDAHTGRKLVFSFGAAGDGVNDDTQALQRAIDTGSGGLRLPAGSYRLTQPLVVELDRVGFFALHGEGAARLIMDGPGPAVRLIGTHAGTASPATVKPEVWDRQRMPLIDGIEIIGRHEKACGIELTGTMQPTLSRVTVRDCLHAVHLTGRNRNVQISDCHLYDNRGVGVYLDGVNLHQINIVGCHISYNDGGGVVSRKSEIRNLQIGTCDIEGNMGDDSPPTANVLLDSTGASVGEVAIVGCTIQHSHTAPGAANIRINGDSPPRPYTSELRTGNITIADNVLSDVQVNIELKHVRGATITGNTIWKGYTLDLLIESCDSLVVADNLFDRNPRYHYGDGADAARGIVIRDASDMIFRGNLIKTVSRQPAAVVLERCAWVQVSGCTILDSDGWQLLLNDCRRCQVADCVLADRRDSTADPKALCVQGGSDNHVQQSTLMLIGETDVQEQAGSQSR
jgi:hypothetical protein